MYEGAHNEGIMKIRPYIMRPVAAAIIISFLFQDVVWANPDITGPNNPPSTLQVPTRFQPIVNDESFHRSLLETNIRLITSGIDIEKFRYRLSPRLNGKFEGLQLVLDFSPPDVKNNKVTGKIKRGDDWVIPCAVRDCVNNREWHYEVAVNPNRPYLLTEGAKEAKPLQVLYDSRISHIGTESTYSENFVPSVLEPVLKESYDDPASIIIKNGLYTRRPSKDDDFDYTGRIDDVAAALERLSGESPGIGLSLRDIEVVIVRGKTGDIHRLFEKRTGKGVADYVYTAAGIGPDGVLRVYLTEGIFKDLTISRLARWVFRTHILQDRGFGASVHKDDFHGRAFRHIRNRLVAKVLRGEKSESHFFRFFQRFFRGSVRSAESYLDLLEFVMAKAKLSKEEKACYRRVGRLYAFIEMVVWPARISSWFMPALIPLSPPIFIPISTALIFITSTLGISMRFGGLTYFLFEFRFNNGGWVPLGYCFLMGLAPFIGSFGLIVQILHRLKMPDRLEYSMTVKRIADRLEDKINDAEFYTDEKEELKELRFVIADKIHDFQGKDKLKILSTYYSKKKMDAELSEAYRSAKKNMGILILGNSAAVEQFGKVLYNRYGREEGLLAMFHKFDAESFLASGGRICNISPMFAREGGRAGSLSLKEMEAVEDSSEANFLMGGIKRPETIEPDERPFLSKINGIFARSKTGIFRLPADMWTHLMLLHFRQSTFMLKSVLESIADGVLVVDIKGRMVAFNKNFVSMWGIPDDIVRSGDDNAALRFVLSQLKDPDAFIDKVKLLYAAPERADLDILRFKNGRIFERRSKPQIIGRAIVGRVWSFRDITARVRSKESLVSERNRLRTLIDGLPHFIYIKDRDSRFVVANEAVARFMGCESPSQLIGKLDSDFFPEPLAAKYYDDEQRIMADPDRKPFNTKEQAVGPSGEVRLIQTTKAPVLDRHGNVIGLIGIGEDITEREADMHNRIRAEKLAAVGTAAAGYAHQIGNPAMEVNAFLQILIGKISRHDYAGAMTECGRMQEQIDRISEAVKRILAYVREEGPGRQELNLADLIKNSLSANDIFINLFGVKVTVNIDKSIAVNANREELLDVFSNIINNAVGALEGVKNGHIEIKAEMRDDGTAMVTVADNGPGADQSEVQNWFKEYYTTKKDKGTGLGLPVANNIIRSHGGSIEIATSKGIGTCVKIAVPAIQASGRRTDVAPRAPDEKKPAPQRTIKRILAVDDEGGIRRIYSVFLGKDYEVTVAGKGQDALKEASRMAGKGTPFDMVITDYLMPGMNGAEPGMNGDELVIKLRRQERGPDKAVIVMLTGFGEASPSSSVDLNGLKNNGFIDAIYIKTDYAKQESLLSLVDSMSRRDLKPVNWKAEIGSVENRGPASGNREPEISRQMKIYPTFPGGIRHGINNTLTPIIGYSGLSQFKHKKPWTLAGRLMVLVEMINKLSDGKNITEAVRNTGEAVRLYKIMQKRLIYLKKELENGPVPGGQAGAQSETAESVESISKTLGLIEKYVSDASVRIKKWTEEEIRESAGSRDSATETSEQEGWVTGPPHITQPPDEFVASEEIRYIGREGSVRYPALGYWLPSDDDVNRILTHIEHVAMDRGGIVITDIGSGTGFLPLYLAEKLELRNPELSKRTRFVGIERDDGDINFFCERLGLERRGNAYVRGNVTIVVGEAADAGSIVKSITRKKASDVVISSWMPQGADHTPFIRALEPRLVVFARSTDPGEVCGTAGSFTIPGLSETDSWPTKGSSGKAALVTILETQNSGAPKIFDQEALHNSNKAKIEQGAKGVFWKSVHSGIFLGAASALYIFIIGYLGLPLWVGGVGFSSGLIMIVLKKRRLFTGDTLLFIPLLRGDISVKQFINKVGVKIWPAVIFGNLIGSIFAVAAATVLYMLAASVWPDMASHIAGTAMRISTVKMSLPALILFYKAVFCNILVTLAVLLGVTAKDPRLKAALIVPPIATFIALKFEHSVANMFLVIFGIAIAAVTGGAGNGILTIGLPALEGFLWNISIVIAGNIVGGFITSAAYYLATRIGADTGKKRFNLHAFDSGGPALFIDARREEKEVRALNDDEHRVLNAALAKAAFTQLEKGNVEFLTEKKVCILFGQEPDETEARAPPEVRVIEDEALLAALPDQYKYLADGLITHAGTWRTDPLGHKHANIFLKRSVYDMLEQYATGYSRHEFRDFWREHELGHLAERTRPIDAELEERETWLVEWFYDEHHKDVAGKLATKEQAERSRREYLAHQPDENAEKQVTARIMGGFSTYTESFGLKRFFQAAGATKTAIDVLEKRMENPYVRSSDVIKEYEAQRDLAKDRAALKELGRSLERLDEILGELQQDETRFSQDSQSHYDAMTERFKKLFFPGTGELPIILAKLEALLVRYSNPHALILKESVLRSVKDYLVSFSEDAKVFKRHEYKYSDYVRHFGSNAPKLDYEQQDFLKKIRDAAGEISASAALASLRLERGYKEATFTKGGSLFTMKNATHPTLKIKDKFEPVAFTVPAEGNAVLISGLNTGGKSVTLKTAGLIALMTQCGMPIPADVTMDEVMFTGFVKPEVSHYDVDIGDASRFAAELAESGRLLRTLPPRTLAIIDDDMFGGSSEPAIVASCFNATVEGLSERKVSVVAVTHHIDALEALKSRHPGYIFKRIKTIPDKDGADVSTYSLEDGIAGSSQGLNETVKQKWPAAAAAVAFYNMMRRKYGEKELLYQGVSPRQGGKPARYRGFFYSNAERENLQVGQFEDILYDVAKATLGTEAAYNVKEFASRMMRKPEICNTVLWHTSIGKLKSSPDALCLLDEKLRANMPEWKKVQNQYGYGTPDYIVDEKKLAVKRFIDLVEFAAKSDIPVISENGRVLKTFIDDKKVSAGFLDYVKNFGLEGAIIKVFNMYSGTEKEKNNAIIDNIRALYGISALAHMTWPFSSLTGKRGEIDIKGGWHSILTKTPSCTPNDVAIGLENPDAREGSLTIYTGFNTGGKSTLAKMIAQVVTLARMGWPVPAASANIGDFSDIQVVSGTLTEDKQRTRSYKHKDAIGGALAAALHESALVLQSATPKTLVILDEPFSGCTEPSVSAALTAALAEGLVKKGATVILITHLLESVPLLTERIPQARTFKAKIAERDGLTIPLYRFEHGVALSSHGFEVAKGMKWPGYERALSYFDFLSKEAQSPTESTVQEGWGTGEESSEAAIHENIRKSLDELMKRAQASDERYRIGHPLLQDTSEVLTMPVALLASSYDRHFKDNEDEAKIVENVRKNMAQGIIPSDDDKAIVAHVRRDGSIFLYEGRHRLEALTLLGVEYAPVHVIYIDHVRANIKGMPVPALTGRTERYDNDKPFTVRFAKNMTEATPGDWYYCHEDGQLSGNSATDHLIKFDSRGKIASRSRKDPKTGRFDTSSGELPSGPAMNSVLSLRDVLGSCTERTVEMICRQPRIEEGILSMQNKELKSLLAEYQALSADLSARCAALPKTRNMSEDKKLSAAKKLYSLLCRATVLRRDILTVTLELWAKKEKALKGDPAVEMSTIMFFESAMRTFLEREAHDLGLILDELCFMCFGQSRQSSKGRLDIFAPAADERFINALKTAIENGYSGYGETYSALSALESGAPGRLIQLYESTRDGQLKTIALSQLILYYYEKAGDANIKEKIMELAVSYLSGSESWHDTVFMTENVHSMMKDAAQEILYKAFRANQKWRIKPVLADYILNLKEVPDYIVCGILAGLTLRSDYARFVAAKACLYKKGVRGRDRALEELGAARMAGNIRDAFSLHRSKPKQDKYLRKLFDRFMATKQLLSMEALRNNLYVAVSSVGDGYGCVPRERYYFNNFEALEAEDHDGILAAMDNAGIKGATIINFDSHDDMSPGATVPEGQWGILALKEGIAKEIVQVESPEYLTAHKKEILAKMRAASGPLVISICYDYFYCKYRKNIDCKTNNCECCRAQIKDIARLMAEAGKPVQLVFLADSTFWIFMHNPHRPPRFDQDSQFVPWLTSNIVDALDEADRAMSPQAASKFFQSGAGPDGTTTTSAAQSDRGLLKTIQQMTEMADRLIQIDGRADANSPQVISGLHDLLKERAFTDHPSPSVISRNEAVWNAMREFDNRRLSLVLDKSGPYEYPRSPAGWLCSILISGHNTIWKSLASLSGEQFSIHMKKVMESFSLARKIGPDAIVASSDLYPSKIDRALKGLREQYENKTSAPAAVLGDLSDERQLADTIVEKTLSIALNKKAVFVFDEKLGSGQSVKMLRNFREMITELKKDPKFARILKDVIVKTGLKSAKAFAGQDNAEVFVFTGDEKYAPPAGNIHAALVNEKNFSMNAYYPLAEIVAITLSNFLDSRTLENVKPILDKLNIASIDGDSGLLIFNLLPKPKEFETQELVKRYARLKDLLRNA